MHGVVLELQDTSRDSNTAYQNAVLLSTISRGSQQLLGFVSVDTSPSGMVMQNVRQTIPRPGLHVVIQSVHSTYRTWLETILRVTKLACQYRLESCLLQLWTHCLSGEHRSLGCARQKI